MSEASGARSETTSRDDFMRGEGFLLYTDFNIRILQSVAAKPIRFLDGADLGFNLEAYLNEEKGIHSANIGLWAVINKLSDHSVLQGNSDWLPLRLLGVTGKDVRTASSKNAFDGGFGDRAFAWHFSAAVAAAAVHQFVEEDKISEDQAAELTLGDWADVIGSAWFSKLIHSLAFTRNGVYGDFGKGLNQYEKGSLNQRLTLELSMGHREDPITHLIVKEQADPVDGVTYLTAQLKPATREALRHEMHREGLRRSSTGCPVARRSARLSEQDFASNRHAAALVRNGVISVRAEASGDRVQIDQPETAIDRTLWLIAWQMDQYDRQYGTPIISLGQDEAAIDLDHEHLEQTGVLKRYAEPQTA